MRKPQTERLGVAALDYFFSQHGWLFREQPTHDYGIDAHIEIVTGQRTTGKLIALQIKTGTSFFAEESDGGFIFRTDDRHIAYWIGHSMPVVVVLFNPNTQQAYWQFISKDSVETTGKGWKILVPKISMFDQPDQSLTALENLTQPEPYIRRLNRLRIDRHWMELIAEGYDVRIEFEDWVNKSLPRYQITISCGEETEIWPTTYTPGVGIEEMLTHFFPWADFHVDEDALDQGAREQWMEQCYGWRDDETDEVFYKESFEDWHEPSEGIAPVSENGETELYCLFLSLNDLGKSFLMLDDYLADTDAPENIGFTIE